MLELLRILLLRIRMRSGLTLSAQPRTVDTLIIGSMVHTSLDHWRCFSTIAVGNLFRAICSSASWTQAVELFAYPIIAKQANLVPASTSNG